MPERAELRVTSSDGTRISAWRTGTGPNLLLVHGTAADHTRWARISTLWEHQLTVYAMDRRGRGGSGDASAYSLEREADDVCAVAEALPGPCTILGHSYGAICCLEAAPRLTNLHRLILYEPPLPGGQPIVPIEARELLDRLIGHGEREAALLAFFREIVRLPEDQIARLRANSAWQKRVDAAHTIPREIRVEDLYRPDFDRIHSIRTETLLLLGGDSPRFFHAAIDRLNQALPNSRTHVFPGQQHVAMDTVPDEFARIVSAFVLNAQPYG